MSSTRFAILAVCVCAFLPACHKTTYRYEAPPYLRQHIGDICTIQFRRDALGAASNLPVPPTTGTINGADVIIVGKLTEVEGDGLVIESTSSNQASKNYWIPYQSILMVEIPKEK